MFLRKINRKKDGKDHYYWALVEPYRTPNGPRQRIVAYLGEMDASGRLGIKNAVEGRTGYQKDIFEDNEPEWVEINVRGVRTEKVRDFGDIWLALQLIHRLGLYDFFKKVMPSGRSKVAWADLACVLTIARFCNPSSELYIAEHFYGHTAFPDIMGIPDHQIYENRLYRAMDKLLPHKDALEEHLKERFGELFNIEYNLLLYDITSTYFEGESKSNPQAKRGYSRDKRPDCKQVLIALVVTKEGIPLGYEVFDGNRHDCTTVEEIIEKMESRYGSADRIWVMDRGMTSEENIDFLKLGNRRYIIGTPKSELKKFEKELLFRNWQSIRDDLEVQYCKSPYGEDEVFILCRSSSRKEKEHAIIERFSEHIEKGLGKIHASCEKGRLKNPSVVERRIGRLLERNTRAAGMYEIEVKQNEDKTLTLVWSKREERSDWARLSEGCYLLRSNVKDLSAEELWQAYIHLTDVESAFRIQKSDLVLRPIWHQKQERVQSHIFVCFLAFVLWKCLAQMCKQNGLGNEPRKVIDELGRIKLTDVILPTRKGVEIKLYCVSKPNIHQQILLQYLGLRIPSRLTKNLKM
jgi:transposase